MLVQRFLYFVPCLVVRPAHHGTQSLRANLLDSTTSMPFPVRPDSSNQYTRIISRVDTSFSHPRCSFPSSLATTLSRALLSF